MRPLLSIVSPVYRAENIVTLLVEQIKEEVSKITENFEVVLVEDGSPDRSWDAILQETKKDTRVKGIKLSRNFGQHYAITAGLDFANGEWVVVMDCDLQDSPCEIIKLYSKALEGNKIVLAQREIRKDSLFKRLSSKLFYKTLTVLTGVKQDASVANFGIYHKDVVATVRKMREPFRNFAAIVKWTGFSAVKISVTHYQRKEGKTSYNLRKLFKLAIDTILAYSNKPLYYIVFLGFMVSVISFIAAIVVYIKYLRGGIAVLGYTSLILSIWVLSGLLMIFLGIVGLYIGKVFESVKNRPLYLIDEKVNYDNP